MHLTIINETVIEYKFSNTISLDLSETILKIYRYLMEHLDFQTLGLLKITPCFNSIAIAFTSSSPLFDAPDFLRETLLQAHESTEKNIYKTHTIKLIYDGLDLDYVCQTLKLSQKEFIQRHQKNTYTIAMLGFKGNFPYLLGLDKGLVLPRRASPRNRVSKGSVAIGGDQCGIYVEDSPGGWHIIANTHFTDFACLEAGDKIVFKAIITEGKKC
ncbi:5-oxoprolinase subunit B family protein [sulfur-oxidizing endosymbiont of Gigantopelta aegis]|uniref:5-oxoprolinase subunit B family protein n=1 Tax=sulfur-oxidizing endosymbiont of Gigantopelta aegis TaxID=2794934 RepID=UPI0018DEBA25|nr:carboxyltransferase domain-containing protein [sulfur-oxidizing endosymbiont of Gigantopelta aegis]